jgi:hypothetical protein
VLLPDYRVAALCKSSVFEKVREKERRGRNGKRKHRPTKNLIEKGRKRVRDKHFIHNHHWRGTQYGNATDAFNLLSSTAEMGSNELFLNSQYVHGI